MNPTVGPVLWAAAVTIATAATPVPQRGLAATPIVLHLSEAVNPTRVTVMYLLNGSQSFYGMHEPHVTVRDGQDIVLDTTLNGAPASTVRAVVYVDGFQFAFADVPSISDAGSRPLPIQLIPLAKTPLLGHVTFPAGTVPNGFVVTIQYEAAGLVLAYFLKGHTGVYGGSFLSNGTEVTKAALDASGNFDAMVPDFAKDPAVAATPGELSLTMRRGSTAYMLQLPSGPTGGLPLTSLHAGRIEFIGLRNGG